MDGNKVSVVVATYNGEKYIVDQMESLRLQTREPDEVIIIDDASSDMTAHIVKRYIENNKLTGWHFIKQKTNKGYIENFNEGFKICSGDVIFPCDQDDVWDRNKIENMVDIIHNDNRIKLLASSINLIDGESNTINQKYVPYDLNNVKNGEIHYIEFAKVLEKNFFPGCTMAIKRELLNEYLVYGNTKIPHDWCLGIISACRKGLYWYNNCLIDYRLHSNNQIGLDKVNKNIWLYAIHMLRTWKQYCEQFVIRVEFVKQNLCPDVENDTFWNEMIKLSNDREKIVLCDNPIKKNLKMWLDEVVIYKKVGKKIDYRGLFLDLLFVFCNK